MSLFILSTSAGVEVLLRMLLRGVLLFLLYDGFLGILRHYVDYVVST